MSRGGWNSTGKMEADGLNKISADFLNKRGFFNDDNCFGIMTWTNERNGNQNRITISSTVDNETQKVHLSYTITKRDGEKKDMAYDVRIVKTPCNYGGVRHWFICPLSVNGKYCGRRVGMLYHGNGDYFGCRHCYGLTYASRNASGRYKGFVSVPDLEQQEMKIKRYYYRGKPTRKYRQYLKMEERFKYGFLIESYLLLSGEKDLSGDS